MRFLDSDAYQPLAAELFDEIAGRLRQALPHARIEHIGSSAIHGAVSKGDLDIYVGVDPDAFEAAIARIEALGFSIKQGTLRTSALCPFESAAYPLEVGVQLVATGSRFEFFLTFRDALNADPSLVRQYNELKVASTGMDPDAYRRRKSRFVEGVLAGGGGAGDGGSPPSGV